MPDWETLPPAARRLFSRMMEVFAGFLSHTDHQVGRLVEFLRTAGELDNTLIMVISDNGASAEGGPTGTTNEAQFFNNAQEPLEESLKLIDELGGPRLFNHYPWGWTWAGNTPFRRWKRETYRGGASDPFIVSWPQRIKARGQVRTQYAHIIDMVPTVLDLLDIEPPKTIRGVTQSPLHGVSFAHTLDDAAAESNRHTQYFEMLGHRAIYHEGWRAVCPWPGPSFAEAGMPFGQPISSETLSRLDATGWELYHVAEDFAENHNVAADHRDMLIAMIGTWYVEAGKYNVMPVDGSGLARMIAEKPLVAVPRDKYIYRPGTQSIPFFAAPRVLNRPHSITAEVEIPEAEPKGCCCARAPPRADTRSSSKTASSATPTTTWAGPSTAWNPTRTSSQASTRSGSNSNRPDRRTWPRARARPAGSRSTWTVPSPGIPRHPSLRRS